MMLTGIFAKTVRDGWKAWLVAVLSLSALFVMAMAVYQDIDLGVYTTLPEVYRSLIGISEEADVGSLAINALIASYGAMTVGALALAMGAASIAGEERKGTLGLLLGNPKSRTYVLVSKAGSMVLLTALGILALWGAIHATAGALNVSIEGMHVGALSLHLFFASVFYGLLAMAIGAWTGNRGAAIGATVGVMGVSFLAAGVLPLVEGAEDLVKAVPWYYFNGSDPLLNGTEWSHIAILGAASAVFGAAAVIGVNRRDLRGQSVGVSLLDRVRANPVTEKVIGRLVGSARVSSIWAKTASEYQAHLTITGVLMFLIMGVMLGPMYAAIPKETFAAFADFPEAMLVLFGGGDITTPEGWYQLETFGVMAPVAVMVVAIAIGAGALAGEEAHRTMGLLLANPIRRSKVVLEKSLTMVLYSLAVGAVTFAGVAVGSVLGDMGMNIGNIAATCLLQSLAGLVFGAVALALSAGTGRKAVAIYAAVGAGIGFHLLNSLGTLNEAIAGWAKWSPFFYYLGNDPLMNGLDWRDAAILTALSAVLIGLSVVLFQRRDLRQHG